MFAQFKHTYKQTLAAPEAGGTLQDGGVTVTPATATAVCIGVSAVVNANGGGANAVTVAFPATGFKSALLLATVACVVTLTGVTVINGATIGTVTLAANELVHVTGITGACTAVSVGANTAGSGPAGVLNMSVIYDA